MFETLVITIAPAISKILLYLWLKDERADAAASFVDVIVSLTQNPLDQKRARRQFEAIGEKIAEELIPLFQVEANILGNDSLAAIAHAVELSLKQSNISSRLLVAQNLDPVVLKNHILSQSTYFIKQFSEVETTFYARLIMEVCGNIIDVATKLPSFQEQTFAEILRRETELLNITEEVLAELRILREKAQRQSSNEAVTLFEIEYRKALRRRLDRLELFGVDVQSSSRRQALSIAYVSLALKKSKRGSRLLNSAEDIVVDDEVEFSVELALTQQNKLLIRGHAGSGKTTLLSWIAIEAASQTFEMNLSSWNMKMPFYIPLREVKEFPRPEHFTQIATPSISGTMPAGWVHAHLRTGDALVLIDGVDEIVDRDGMRNWVQALSEDFPLVTYIVTSRPSSIDPKRFEEIGFIDSELLPMTNKDIIIFIDRWHQAVKENVAKEDKPQLDILAEELKRQIRERRALRNLATNPLLCAMLCALFRQRNRQIPTDRIELYESCCQMLLERRDEERGVIIEGSPPLTYRQKSVLLEELAYGLIIANLSEIPFADAVEIITLAFNALENRPAWLTAEYTLKFLLERSGLIREPVKGQLDFVHRTFQEFLAAKAIVANGRTALLTKMAVDSEWREVIIIAMGIAPRDRRNKLLQKLIEFGDTNGKQGQQLHLLAMSCLETVTDIDPQLKDELSKRISRLIPPRTMADAKSLASAKDLAVPHLAKIKFEYANVTATTIRTLALIGTESALNVLGMYINDTRQTVISELIRGIEYFNTEEYIDRVLKYVDFSNYTFTSLDIPIHLKLSNLRYKFSTDTAYRKGSFLLTSRTTIFTPIDYDSIPKLTKLKHLLLDFSPHEDSNINYTLLGIIEFNLIPLKELESLENLTIVGNYYKLMSVDLAVIGKLNISHLELIDIENFQNVSEFASLTHVASLSITIKSAQYHELVDVIDIMTSVKDLRIQSTFIDDISFVLKLTKSKRIVLIASNISQLNIPEKIHELFQVTYSGSDTLMLKAIRKS